MLAARFILLLVPLLLLARSSSSSSHLSSSCVSWKPAQLHFSHDYDSSEAPPAPPAGDPDADFVLDYYDGDRKRYHGGAGGGGDDIYILANHFVMEVTKVDDLYQLVRMPVYAEKSWFDSRLTLDPGIDNLEVSEEFFKYCLWAPNFIYAYLVEARVWSTIKNPFLFRITRVGNLTLVTQASYVIVTVSCIMDFDLYPFDKQICYTLETTMMQAMDMRNNSFQRGATSALHFLGNFFHDDSGQRQLQYHLKMEGIDHHLFNEGKLFGLNLPYTGWRLLLKRKLHLHMSEVFFPTTTFVCLSWLGFLIPPDVVPGRMTLLVTLLLVLVNILNHVSETVPSSDKFTAFGFWLVICIMMVVAALAEYGFVLFLLRRATSLEVKWRRLKGRKGDDAPMACARKLRLAVSAVDGYSLVAFPFVAGIVWAVFWIYYMCLYTAPFSDTSDPVMNAFVDVQ